MRAFPQEIGKLKRLRILNARGNKIEQLPSSLASCFRLGEDHNGGSLKLAGNPLEEPLVRRLKLNVRTLLEYLGGNPE